MKARYVGHDPVVHTIIVRTTDGKLKDLKVATNFFEASTLKNGHDYEFTLVNDQVVRAVG